jgi:hypothetical protein
MGLASTAVIGRVAVGNGRGDGSNRVYVGESAFMTGGIYEYSYSAGTWNKAMVNPSVQVSSIVGLKIGSARNDGTMGLYVSGYGLAEFIYQSGAWSGNGFGPNTIYIEWNNGIALGPGRDDSLVRLYVADYNKIDEVSYFNGKVWTGAAINTSNQGPSDVIVAQGRNDGIDRLYTVLGQIWEYTWNSMTNTFDAAQCSSLSTTATFTLLGAGVGRNDGIQRIYAWGGSGLYEFSYSVGTWTNVQIGSVAFAARGTDAPGYNLGSLVLADGRNDGKIRLYVADSTGVIEYTFSGSWTKSSAITSRPAGGLDVGNGRNDGVRRVYVTENYDVYEYSAQK